MTRTRIEPWRSRGEKRAALATTTSAPSTSYSPSQSMISGSPLASSPSALSRRGGLNARSFTSSTRCTTTSDIDVEALASVGIDLHEVRRRIEDAFGPSALDGPPPCRTGTALTDKALRALKATPRHARRLGHRRVGPEHLLLALIEDETALAVQLIQRLGTDPEVLRHQLLDAIESK